jgi:hypothetical protein
MASLKAAGMVKQFYKEYNLNWYFNIKLVVARCQLYALGSIYQLELSPLFCVRPLYGVN